MENNELLKIVADNPNLFETLKTLILDEFEITPPQSDLGVEDLVLGQILRARLVGKNKVESAFKKILTYKTMEEGVEKINRGR